jgi:hypothetical protein
MKRSTLITLAVSLLSCTGVPAVGQSSSPELGRPRTVASPATKGVKEDILAAPEETHVATPATIHKSEANRGANATFLTPQLVRSRITEAERLLKSHPKQTALGSPSTDFVTLAALERTTGRIHLLNISKEIFLDKDSEISIPSSLGTLVTIRVLRANGVNTAVTVVDTNGQSFVPLIVEFPIEKRGVFREMAYYTSAHPALLSAELTKTGRAYVRNMLDLAARRLQDKGKVISPQIIDVAERLCLVEHIDHGRFRAENRLALFDEIYSLYALNETDTYRYSVSFAGAGGMVQMIPWAYNLMRQRHPGAGLIPDFVTGMRNHGNALQAMLLYMQDTWNDLSANDDVQYALNAKLATQPELLAAGYNSNAAKLPGYIRRGGAGWRTLIPRETQVYLQIYKAVDGLVPMKSRATPATVATN